MQANTVYYRNAPHVVVARGFWGNESLYLTAAFPIDSTVTSIASGQIIYVGPNSTWLLASATTAKGQVPYIAMEDSTASDVQSVGKLLGLSLAQSVDLQTAYVDLTQVYTRGSVLTYSATPGLLTVAGATAGNGWIQNPSVDAIGSVTGGIVDFNAGGPGNMNGSLSGYVANAGINSESLPIGAGNNYVYAGQIIAANNANVGKIPMLSFVSRWTPARDVTNTVS